METISIKLEKQNGKSTMHRKLSDSEKTHLLKEIKRLHGISKHRTTDEQIHIAGERVSEMLEKSFKKR